MPKNYGDIYDLKYYIITPKVKNYVAEYFGCHSDQIGALLENTSEDYVKNPPFPHWEKLVFRDELMTPVAMSNSLRITKISLALLEDTGYYQEVDYSLTETVHWGRLKGCDFARGSSRLLADCEAAHKNPDSSCDFTGTFVRYCQATQYSNSVAIDVAYISKVCISDEPSTEPENAGFTFGHGSRCLVTGVNNKGGCFRARCSSDAAAITVQVKDATGLCQDQGTPFVTQARTSPSPEPGSAAPGTSPFFAASDPARGGAMQEAFVSRANVFATTIGLTTSAVYTAKISMIQVNQLLFRNQLLYQAMRR